MSTVQAGLFSPSRPDSTPTLREYAEYRDSGIPWLKCVPAHWTVRRLKTCLVRNDGGVWGEDFDPEGTVVLRSTEQTVGGDWKIDDPARRSLSASERAAALLEEGDLVITKSSGSEFHIGKTSIVSAEVAALGCCFSNFMQRLRCDRRTAPRFAYYILNSPIGREQMIYGSNTSTGLANLNGGVIGNIIAAWPPLPEQEAIAAWLDERTRRVDELVAAKQRLIDLLAEQRTALITHAVTKGLNPAAPMQPSGIDWLGDVPGHWEVKRVRHLVSRIEQGWSPEADQREANDDEWAVMRAGCANGGSFDETDNKALPAGVLPDPSLEIRPGDLLMSRACGSTDLVGSVALVRACRRKLLLCDKLFRLRYRRNLVTPEFLAMALGSRLVRFQLERDLSGAEGLARNIAQSAIKELVVLVPSVDEQRAIVAHLDATCARFDALTAAAETAIARLTEYRQALISAAVTGKINVCGTDGHALADEASAGAPAVVGRIGGATSGTERTANKHFQRSVLAAEIIARIGQDRTFGRVKLQKALILAEGHLQLAEIESQPVRAAAGPFDNAMMRSIQSQLKKSQWYEYTKDGKPLKFVPLAKAGGHKVYFERYWGAKETGFAALMALLARLDTRRSEIVATLYSAWNDFLIDGEGVTDDAVVAEVLTRWDPAKTAIPEAKWRAALPWMRGQGLVPTGYGAHTRVASRERSKE